MKKKVTDAGRALVWFLDRETAVAFLLSVMESGSFPGCAGIDEAESLDADSHPNYNILVWYKTSNGADGQRFLEAARWFKSGYDSLRASAWRREQLTEMLKATRNVA